MLSHPPQSGLPPRLRQGHRRQNSTPTALEAMKIAQNLPNMHPQQQRQQQARPRGYHRRGISLDTRQLQHGMHSPTPRQEFQTVSDQYTNNTGFNNRSQHVLREAQQQRIARPGPPQQAFANLASDENYIISPHTTPRTQGFEGFEELPQDPRTVNVPFDMYNGPMNVVMKKNPENISTNMAGSQDFDLFPTTSTVSAMSTPTFVNFSDSPNGPGWISEEETSATRRNSRRISDGIMDRVAKFENMGMEGPQGPRTPPQQNVSDYFPLTPLDTPHDGTIRHSRGPQRFTEEYDESMEQTIKPNHQTPTRRPQTTFEEMRLAAESQPMMPTPPRPNTMPMAGSYVPPPSASPNLLDLNQINAGIAMQAQLDSLPGPSYAVSVASDLSNHTTPVTPYMSEFGGPFDNRPNFSRPGSTLTDSPSCRGSPHRRNESIASIASAASIAGLDIEKTKTETGITLDDIQQYIDGPDPRDNKWVCTFEDCQKRFGRKENIKSHVQTHLNDRQYRCPTCQKCFVRQHDLKRHAKIHTGIKPYPCECGNAFARHDALTRHKQRGMCIGAYEGVVRRVVKRGRPRKHRPDMDERKDKATRTRKKNKSTSSASSDSGYTDTSTVNSPGTENEFDLLEDIMDVPMAETSLDPTSLHGTVSSSAPMPTLGVGASTPDRPSPPASVHSYVSNQMSHMSLQAGQTAEALPSNPASPAKSVASQYNEPPELSQSSSPPPSGVFFDSEPNSSGISAMISSAAETGSIPSLAGLEGNDDDLLLQFTNDESNMLMLSTDSKFEEAFDSTVDMFGNDNDLFYTTN